MRIPLPRTLLWRFGLALIVIQAVVVCTIGWFTWRSARAFHYEQTLHHLERMTPLLASSYVDFLEAGAIESLDERVTRDGRSGKLRITVIAADGTVLADSHSDPLRMENHSARPEVAAARTANAGTAIRYSDSVDMNMLYFAQQFGSGERGVTLRTAVPLTVVRSDLRRLLGTVAIAGAASMALTLGVGYLVSRRLSWTVASLADRAKEFSVDDPQNLAASALHAASVRELQPVVDALNGLAGRLHRRIEQLQVQQREHEAILQSMNCGIIALDRQQRVLRTNRAADELLGITLNGSNINGRLLQEIVRQPELHEYVEVAIRGGEQNRAHPAELRFRAPDRTVQASAGAMTDAAGRPAGVLLVLNDLTPLRRLESMRSDFAANVSHELRTPITNIKGYVETLLDVGVEDAKQARQFLDIIKRNSDRLGAIIEDILSLAWLEQPGTRDTLAREVVPIRMITSAVVREFSNAAEAKSITLRNQVPDDLQVQINAPLIEQAVANYVSNAIKYSPPGTSVLIRAEQRGAGDGGMIELSVSDQGQGIASEHVPRIFERFYRVDKARSRELGGTGLGLAIVKHIALIHGGRVAVESRVGKGSTFKLILPA